MRYAALALVLALWPVYSASTQQVTLYSDPCKLAAVANLPQRATWHEGGKTYQGCWGIAPRMGIVLAYFEDRTVVAIPVQSFKPLGPVVLTRRT